MRLHDAVIHDQTISVRRSVIVGDWPGARAVFPGPPVVVRRVGRHLEINGTLLDEGDAIDIDLGSVAVTLSHTPKRWTDFGRGGIDRRFLAAVVVLVVSGHWLDAAGHWAASQAWPEEAQEVLRTVGFGGVHGESAPTAAAMRAQRSDRSSDDWYRNTDGPRHLNDDAVTGVGYHRWFKRVVPTDPNAFQANARLDLDPDAAP